MQRALKCALPSFAIFIATACLSPCVAAEPLAEHVVLVTVDGLPAYLLDDPSAVLPNIRGLAERGSRAAGMIVSNPSVTWPNHTTLVTGVYPAKHGVLFNGLLERPGLGVPVKVDPRRDKLELVQVPTLFDILHQQGKTSAGINWPCTRNSKTLGIDFPDSPESLDHTTPELIAELKESGAVPEEAFKTFGSLSAPARDRIWTLAACHVIRTRKPNFMMFHLLNVDGTHHKYGPKSAAGYSAVAYADSCVGDLLDAIDEAGIADKTAVIIVSDHGFIPIPKSLRPNVLLRKAGLLTVEGKSVATAKVYAVPEGGTALVYLTSPDTADADREQAIAAFQGQEGIDEVLTPEAFGELGLPTPMQSRQAPDLVLSAKDGYGFNADPIGEEFVIAAEGTPGTHGFLSTNPRMNAVFVAAGAGVRKGTRLDIVENVSVAPTIARLLGVLLESADGEPLAGILQDSSDAVRSTGLNK
ncbi:MAG: alkaline phosphatase family protein [Planctomycetota bacterium]|nr:alkaline phosphatase family protein [Planctomycetaceae bacterium]MDQ3331251.1 alkaline phosphatase family protein [Planctomycetota bacterium]